MTLVRAEEGEDHIIYPLLPTATASHAVASLRLPLATGEVAGGLVPAGGMGSESPKSEGSSSSVAAAPSVPPVRKLNGGRSRGAAAAPRKAPTMPTPEELVALYESQGMEPREASLRVIKDLQTVLYRTVSSGRGRRDRFTADTGRKLDNVGARLAIVEMKLDSKPGYPQLLALGVAAGAVLQGVGSAAPHVLGAFGKMWRAVFSAGR